MEDNHYEPKIGEVFNYHSPYGLVVTKTIEGNCCDCDFYKSVYCDFGLKCLPKERSDGKHVAFKKNNNGNERDYH